MAASQVLLATAGYDHTIKFWEAPSGICQRTLQHPESQVNKLEITPDKTAIAAAGNPSLRLFDLRTGTATSYDGHTNNVTAVGFQRDGRWLFTGSEDGTIKIWDVRAPGCQREYESGCAINSVAIHPSQGELISGDRDGNIRVWDLAQNACSAELVPDGPKAIRCVSVAHDASLLAAANDYGSVFVWRIGTSDERTSTRFEPLQKLQVTCAALARGLACAPHVLTPLAAHARRGRRKGAEPVGGRRASVSARCLCAGTRYVHHQVPGVSGLPAARDDLRRQLGEDLGHGVQLQGGEDSARAPAVGVGRRLLGRLRLPRDRLLRPDGEAMGRRARRDDPTLHGPPQGGHMRRAA